ncbi:hypothetical protein HPHPH16_1124 [Helicobacter pylori Hp H-16]|nr:hypothetical protein HPHPH16_1124 [Helicobacter pylori Hp H-16]
MEPPFLTLFGGLFFKLLFCFKPFVLNSLFGGEPFFFEPFVFLNSLS